MIKVILLLGMLAFAGCKAKKQMIISTPAAAAPGVNNDKSEKLKAITATQLAFTTLAIKAKADLNIDKSENDVTMNFRIKKDEVIWVTVNSPLIGEVARALITPDSLKLINRLDASYSLKPFSFIQNFANDQINFQTLQSILAGNVISDFLKEDALTEKNNQIVLSGILKALAFQVVLNDRNKVVKTNIKQNDTGEELEINYSDFYSVAGSDMPYGVNITSNANHKNINIHLKYSKVNVNESLEFPFKVPERYTLKN